MDHPAGTSTSDPGHYDYSQTPSYLVHPKVLVDGGTDREVWMDFADVLRDPELSYLVNDDGPLSKAHPHYSGGGTSGVPGLGGDPALGPTPGGSPGGSPGGGTVSSGVLGYGVVAAVTLGLFWLTLRKP
jgi:hypothetical protein